MKKCFCFFLFIFSLHSLNALDAKFGWSIGNIELYYDFIHNDSIAHFELLRFDWLINDDIGIGFSTFEMQNTNGTLAKYCLLPIEISYIPLNYNDLLYFAVYGRLGWQFRQDKGAFNNNPFPSFFSPDNGFYGAVGVRLFLFPDFKFHYSGYTSVFFEYTVFNELKIGFSIDIGALIVGALMAWQQGIEKKRANEWEKKPDFDDKDRRDKMK